jgi:putative Ca2+/H+ antiporter (TMEM165/GDT1 family)
MTSIFFATYGAVFVAEIVGDKLLYTTGVLATRYRPMPIAFGMALAFMCKMAVAVAIGDLVAHLPRPWVIALTAASFIGVAIALWRKPDARRHHDEEDRLVTGMAVAFAAVFFSEWGDVGMVMAGTMAVRFVWSAQLLDGGSTSHLAAAIVVWLGAVSAMITKGMLAVTLGAGARRWVTERLSPRVVRYVAVSAIIFLGVLCVLETAGILVE